MKRIVMFSGGLGSWATARRVKDKFGTDDLYLVFADTKGNNDSIHAGEDASTYDFITAAAADIGGELVWLNEGRDIWQVFNDEGRIGSPLVSNCSRALKQQPSRRWLEENCDPSDTIIYMGIDITELHRLGPIQSAYAHYKSRKCTRPKACTPAKPCPDDNMCRSCWPCRDRYPCEYRLPVPWKVEAPLTKRPLLSKEMIRQQCIESGLEIPRLYTAGYPHNNCGGFCVKAGHAQFKHLLEENPERYAYHEQKEEEFRTSKDKDVAILRDRTGGKSVPLTLKTFRERVEQEKMEIDPLDFGGCGCFIDESET